MSGQAAGGRCGMGGRCGGASMGMPWRVSVKGCCCRRGTRRSGHDGRDGGDVACPCGTGRDGTCVMRVGRRWTAEVRAVRGRGTLW